MSGDDLSRNSRGRPFPEGRFGNPSGRPKGARNRATRAAEELLDGDAAAITRKAIEMALGGDSAAIRLCLERILPARRERAIRVSIPKLSTPQEASEALATIIKNVAQGIITPGEGINLAKIIDDYVRSLEANELHQRLRRIEEWAVRFQG